MRSPASLFQQYQLTGNMDIMADLYQSRRKWFVNGLRRCGIDNTEDALQEAWIRIDRGLRAGMYVPGKASITSWMFTIVFNNALNEKRAEAKRKTLDMEDTDMEAILSDDDDEGDLLGFDAEELPSIIGLYKLLPFKPDKSGRNSRAIAVEHRLMGLTFKETSAITGIKAITLRGAHAKAVNEIRALADQGIRNPEFTELDLLQLETTGAKLRQQIGAETFREKRMEKQLKRDANRAARLSAKYGINPNT